MRDNKHTVVLCKSPINHRVPMMQVFALFAVYCVLGTKCFLQKGSKSFMVVGGSGAML